MRASHFKRHRSGLIQTTKTLCRFFFGLYLSAYVYGTAMSCLQAQDKYDIGEIAGWQSDLGHWYMLDSANIYCSCSADEGVFDG